MTTRELWRNIMYYGEFDRMPVIHWAGWDETYERWRAEGMPKDVDVWEYFDAVAHWFMLRPNVHFYPVFEEETLEETDEYRVFRDHEGVIKKDWKHRSCIPQFLDFALKTAADWPAYKARLQPDPGRIPDDFDTQLADAERLDLPINLFLGSMMGWIRNWMGVENMSYLMYDAPDVYADMVDTLSDLACWTIEQVVPRVASGVDAGHCWEDICGKSGPLVSPAIFDRCVANGYRKIRAKLEEYGITLFSIDSDGDISQLARGWFEAGVNVFFPIEPGTWGADPAEYRKTFGKELRIVGGLDKLALEKGPDAIDAEIERKIPLMKEGGFVAMPDHLITPGTPLANYKYYLERMRQLRF